MIAPSTCSSYNGLPWDKFEQITNSLYKECPDIEEIGDYIGISLAQLLKYKQSPPNFNDKSDLTLLYKRFYIAIVLYRLVNEQPLIHVSKLMHIERGKSQAIQKESVIFCNMLITFCKKLNWNLLAYALDSLLGRLNYCVSEDYLPLARLGGEMTSIRCRVFFKNHIKTPFEIVQAGVYAIAGILVSSL